MAKYTRPGAEPPNQLRNEGSPLLLFKKWQAYDDFDEFKITKSRKDYWQFVQQINERVQSTYYQIWLDAYQRALENIPGVQCIDQYKTQWRLLVGYGTNPTLESGIMLHHLYGFPYIPASEVKGLLHHVAEMLAMEGITDVRGYQVNLPEIEHIYEGSVDFATEPQSLLIHTLGYLSAVKALFGSIHLEKGKNEDNESVYGPTPPLELLKKLQRQAERSMNDQNLKKSDLPDTWKQVLEQLQWLTGEHTGGILRFYDAVPALDQSELLQLDVLTPHYPEYYKENSTVPPSDTQSPNPVTFLTVKPGVKFLFYFRNEYVSIMRAGDDARKEIKAALEGWSEQQVVEQVKQWLHKALTEWGIGAKTSAGYGYFIDEGSGNTPSPSETGGGSVPKTKYGKDVPISEGITPEEPPTPAPVKTAPKGINKNFAPGIWNKLAINNYIAQIQGKTADRVPFAVPVPNRLFTARGSRMTVYYQNDRFYCTVELKLNGIKNEQQAEWVWQNVILPELPPSEEEDS